MGGRGDERNSFKLLLFGLLFSRERKMKGLEGSQLPSHLSGTPPILSRFGE